MNHASHLIQNEIVLDADDVSCQYSSPRANPFRRMPPHLALSCASMEIRRGESIGIVGSSGAGKTTFARIISGQIKPTTGCVRFLGEDLETMSKSHKQRFRRGVQYVFQNPRASFDPRLRLGTSLTEPLRSIGTDGDHALIVRETLMKVGLAPEMVSRFPHEFSGGQLQRMAIARALVLRPEVLIADEPASSLDVSVRAQILNLFRELTEDRSMALILIAHDLAAVAYTTKRIAVFSGGKIVEHGDVLSVLTAPREEATRELVRANISL